MSDTEQTQPGADVPDVQATTAKDDSKFSQLNRENQKYREELRETQKRLAALTTEKENAEKAEQGKYKELLEASEKEKVELKKLADEALTYRAEDEEKLTLIKKTMDKSTIDLLDQLPPTLTAKQRLEWASKLSGKKPVLPAEPRPGAADMESVDQVLTEFKKADMRGRSRMLAQYKDTPAIYERLKAG